MGLFRWGLIAFLAASAVVSIWLGRPLLYRLAETKWAHALLINRRNIENAEQYFVKHGKASTFVGRLVPAVRQLISIPAGLSRMNIGAFLLYTFLGAGLWNVVLALIGYFAYDMRDHILPYLDWLMYAVGALFVVFLAVKGIRAYRNRKKSAIQ